MAADGFLLSDCKNLLSEIEPRDQTERELIMAILTLHRSGFSGFRLQRTDDSLHADLKESTYLAEIYCGNRIGQGGNGYGETSVDAARMAIEKSAQKSRLAKGDKV